MFHFLLFKISHFILVIAIRRRKLHLGQARLQFSETTQQDKNHKIIYKNDQITFLQNILLALLEV